MISRGPGGRLHTSWCSASDHHRTTGLSVCCWARGCWIVLPPGVRRVLTALAFVLLAVATGALATAGIWWLFKGVVV